MNIENLLSKWIPEVRVWDKELGIMITENNYRKKIKTYENDSLYSPEEIFGFREISLFKGVNTLIKRHPNRFVVMYQLPYRDVNDKKIFVGDILRIWICGNLQEQLFLVRGIKEFFEAISDIPYYRISKIEIVGNVFQNTELINQCYNIERS